MILIGHYDISGYASSRDVYPDSIWNNKHTIKIWEKGEFIVTYRNFR